MNKQCSLRPNAFRMALKAFSNDILPRNRKLPSSVGEWLFSKRVRISTIKDSPLAALIITFCPRGILGTREHSMQLRNDGV